MGCVESTSSGAEDDRKKNIDHHEIDNHRKRNSNNPTASEHLLRAGLPSGMPSTESPAPNPFLVGPQARSDEYGESGTGEPTIRTTKSGNTTECVSPLAACHARRTHFGDDDANSSNPISTGTTVDQQQQGPPTRQQHEQRRISAIQQHTNSLERYQSSTKPPITTAVSSTTAAGTRWTSTNSNRRSSSKSSQRPPTPFESPQQYMLLFQEGSDALRLEELWEQQVHATLAKVEWTVTIR